MYPNASSQSDGNSAMSDAMCIKEVMTPYSADSRRFQWHSTCAS
jgi:hypothetical protein